MQDSQKLGQKCELKSLDLLAKRIVGTGLAAPALFFLEISKPLSTIAHTASLAFEPFALPFLGNERIRVLQFLLSERENVEALAHFIEQHALKKPKKALN